MLAPAYLRTMPSDAPNPLPAGDGSMRVQSRQAFLANWDRQVGCPGQYEPEASEAVWAALVATDSVGAKWGPGVRRAPVVAQGRAFSGWEIEPMRYRMWLDVGGISVGT